MNSKVILITGGARGLGKSFAEAFLDRGAKVCIADILEEEGKKTEQELGTKFGGNNVVFCKCDVTDDKNFQDAWEKGEETLGNINILVNNAGTGNDKNWQRSLEINLGGCVRGTMLALKKMSKNQGAREGGTILNISSIVALKTLPFGPIYSAGKAAIVGFTRSIGHEFHRSITGVSVHCLCPSLVQTGMISESVANAFSPECAKGMQVLTSKAPAMTASFVSSALLKLLEDGKTGGVMVVEYGKDPYYVEPQLPS